MFKVLLIISIISTLLLSSHAEPADSVVLQCSGRVTELSPDKINKLSEEVRKSTLLPQSHLSHTDLSKIDFHGGFLLEQRLDGAILTDADLQHTNFYKSSLECAQLSFSNLQGADLRETNLVRAGLVNSLLQYAHLDKADLRNANLQNVSLVGASLVDANLENANLQGAHLEGAHLERTRLAGANLAGAHLKGAHLDLLPGSLPDPLTFSDVKGLERIDFSTESAGLVRLRNQLKELGMRYRENQVNYAIKRSELNRRLEHHKRAHSVTEQWLNYILFDLTCEYGLSPGRPLFIVVMLIFVFAAIYLVGQIFPGRRGGIWAIWDDRRIDRTQGDSTPQRLTHGLPNARQNGRVFAMLNLAAYFSLLSAVRIGWSGLDFGTWITRMQPGEYTLSATGWIKVTSGIQSLISVYLIALTLLTYFGTPFEY